MPIIDGNFNEVPDVMQSVEPAVYMFLVNSMTIEYSKGPNGQPDESKKKAVIELTIMDDGPMKGRKLTDHVSLKMLTKLKRVALSAGLTSDDIKGGIDTTLIEGKTVHGVVKKEFYTDPKDGKMKEASRLADYLIPGDDTEAAKKDAEASKLLKAPAGK